MNSAAASQQEGSVSFSKVAAVSQENDTPPTIQPPPQALLGGFRDIPSKIQDTLFVMCGCTGGFANLMILEG